jgi:Bacterial Ig-like domain (group 2)
VGTEAVLIGRYGDAEQADLGATRFPSAPPTAPCTGSGSINVAVMDRLVVIGRHGGLASNFDCPGCPCPPNDTGLSVSPATAYMTPGGTGQMTATGTQTNCNGQNYYYDDTDSATWSSANTAVATVSSTGLVTGHAGGSAGITASLTGYTYNPYYNCSRQSHNEVGAGSCDVQVPAYVGVAATSTGSSLCSGSSFSARYLKTTYQVLDSSKSAINMSGMSVAEQLSWTSGICTTSNGCGQKPTAYTWTTDSTGTITIPDTIQNCSSTCTHGGSCAEDWQQTFSVNGASVGIVNGSATGTLNCITTSCSSSPQGITH